MRRDHNGYNVNNDFHMKKFYDAVTNHTYTVVGIPGFRPGDFLPTDRILMIKEFGPAGSRWFYRDGQLFFRDEKDYAMFLLKWK
jgi:hypothetical protein